MSGYKQISMTHQQGTHGVCYRLLCTNLGDKILCTLSSNHNIHWENGVDYWWSTYALKSKSVSEMHFRAMLMCFCWYSNLVSHTQTHTHIKTYTTLCEPVDWHTHINIYLHHLLCAHSCYLYYIECIIHCYQNFPFHNVFCFQKLFTCKSHISVD